MHTNEGFFVEWWTKVHHAVECNAVDVVNLLIVGHAGIDAINYVLKIRFFLAAFVGSIVKRLYESGPHSSVRCGS